MNNLTCAIGETPLRELKKTKEYYNLASNIYAKLEWYNPYGSIKDRIVYQMIISEIEKGNITAETILCEATSGNTGIALAGISSALGIKCIVVMPEGMSEERKTLILGYHQKVMETPKSEGMAGAIKKANQMCSENKNILMLRQFENPNNPLAHEKTADEIYQTLGGAVDVIVVGIGTGGTITGLSRQLKKYRQDLIVVGIEPSSSPFITKGIQGPHLIQGIGAGFIPKILDLQLIDEVIIIDDDLIYQGVKKIQEVEGLEVGLSSVANYFGAIEIARKYPKKNIVTIFPDDASKYQSILGQLSSYKTLDVSSKMTSQ